MRWRRFASLSTASTKATLKWPKPLVLIKHSSSTIFHLTSGADQEPPRNGFMILAAMGKKHDMSDPFVTLRKPRQVNATGSHAYVVVPINLRYKDKGHLVSRTGLMTLALHKGVAGWRIAAWAWTWD